MSDRPVDPIDDDRLSALLDGELDPAEDASLRAELAADPVRAAALEALAEVRAALRSAAPVEPPHETMSRIIAAVAADDPAAADTGRPPAPVVALRTRRVPALAAALAAAVVIIASVVGGVGGATTIPALGDLVARHDAAAAERVPADVDPMPMDDMDDVGPTMPDALSMTGAYRTDDLVHLVYRDGAGAVVSVFRQDGDTDVDRLPTGEVTEMGGHPVWSSTVEERHVAVVDGDGYVWTVVGVDDHDTMMVAMADDLPRREPGFVDRLVDAADLVVRPWRAS